MTWRIEGKTHPGEKKKRNQTGLSENSPRKLEAGPVTTSLATWQIHFQSNHIVRGFFFSNLLLSLGLCVKVICKTFVGQMGRKGEKERQAGREEMRGCSCWQTQQWMKQEGQLAMAEKGARSLASRGQGRALLWKLGEILVVMSETEHLPSKDLPTGKEGTVQSANSLCNKENQEMGKEH